MGAAQSPRWVINAVTNNDAERRTHKAATPALSSCGPKSRTMLWNAPAMKVVRSGKPMLWSRGKRVVAARLV